MLSLIDHLRNDVVENINETAMDELIIEFRSGLVLVVTGGHCRDIFTDLKRKIVTYEPVKE